MQSNYVTKHHAFTKLYNQTHDYLKTSLLTNVDRISDFLGKKKNGKPPANSFAGRLNGYRKLMRFKYQTDVCNGCRC